MAVNDPIGDMITRIRNAQLRKKSKVSTPASRLRVGVLDVLKTEGFIRGYAAVEHSNGHKEIEIELSAMPASLEVMAPPGMEELTQQIQSMFSSMGRERRKPRKMPVKEALKLHLEERGISYHDLGTHDRKSTDYPDYAQAVGESVAEHKAELGLLVCTTGIGMSIAANYLISHLT